MKSLLTTLPLVLPIAQVWAEKQELVALAEGSPLTRDQLTDAKKVGVQFPEKIRVVRVETLPHPANEDLMFLAKQMGLFSSDASGLSVGYAVFLPPKVWHDRYRLVHECVHVAQFERKGGLRPFLADYLRECVEPGYPFGPMEQEAIRVAKDLCKTPISKATA